MSGQKTTCDEESDVEEDRYSNLEYFNQLKSDETEEYIGGSFPAAADISKHSTRQKLGQKRYGWKRNEKKYNPHLMELKLKYLHKIK